jgi:hypothetical protein
VVFCFIACCCVLKFILTTALPVFVLIQRTGKHPIQAHLPNIFRNNLADRIPACIIITYDASMIKAEFGFLLIEFNCQLVEHGISATSVSGIKLLNIILIVLNQCSNKSTLFSLTKKLYFMNTKIQQSGEERREKFENLFLEVLASLFVVSLIFFCFWILFKS